MLAMALTRCLEILGEGCLKNEYGIPPPAFPAIPFAKIASDAQSADPRLFRCGFRYRLRRQVREDLPCAPSRARSGACFHAIGKWLDMGSTRSERPGWNLALTQGRE